MPFGDAKKSVSEVAEELKALKVSAATLEGNP